MDAAWRGCRAARRVSAGDARRVLRAPRRCEGAAAAAAGGDPGAGWHGPARQTAACGGSHAARRAAACTRPRTRADRPLTAPPRACTDRPHAQVYKGRRRCTGQIVAMKFIVKQGKSEKDVRNLRQEIEILRHLRHENIIQMLDAFETRDHFVVVMGEPPAAALVGRRPSLEAVVCVPRPPYCSIRGGQRNGGAAPTGGMAAACRLAPGKPTPNPQTMAPLQSLPRASSLRCWRTTSLCQRRLCSTSRSSWSAHGGGTGARAPGRVAAGTSNHTAFARAAGGRAGFEVSRLWWRGEADSCSALHPFPRCTRCTTSTPTASSTAT
jgi:hypothetical protein